MPKPIQKSLWWGSARPQNWWHPCRKQFKRSDASTPSSHHLPLHPFWFPVYDKKKRGGSLSGTSIERTDFTTIRHLYSHLFREPTKRDIAYRGPRSKGITPVLMWHRPDTSFILPCPVSSFFPLHFHSQHPCETCWMVWFCWDTLHTSIKNYSSTISFTCSSLGKINTGFGRHFHPVLHRERGRNHSSTQVWGFFF